MKEKMHSQLRINAESAIQMSAEDEHIFRTMHEFLVWLERAKGLTLCRAFKPQYDWYMPAFPNKEKLAREYLSEQESQALLPHISKALT